jgi:hypothetical protein
MERDATWVFGSLEPISATIPTSKTKAAMTPATIKIMTLMVFPFSHKKAHKAQKLIL